MLFLSFAASGASNIVVVVTDDKPTDDMILNDDGLTELGSHEGDLQEGDTIKIRPDKSVNGQYVVIYLPGEGILTLGDVKVYVKPTVDIIEVAGPGEPDGPQEAETGPTDCSSGDNPTDAIDGKDETCFATGEDETAWWSVDLGGIHEISAIHVTGCGNGK